MCRTSLENSRAHVPHRVVYLEARLTHSGKSFVPLSEVGSPLAGFPDSLLDAGYPCCQLPEVGPGYCSGTSFETSVTGPVGVARLLRRQISHQPNPNPHRTRNNGIPRPIPTFAPVDRPPGFLSSVPTDVAAVSASVDSIDVSGAVLMISVNWNRMKTASAQTDLVLQ